MRQGKSCGVERLEHRRLLSGSGWSTVDTWQLAAGKNALANGGLAADAQGNVYAAGKATDAAGAWHGIIREKRAGTTDWATVQDLPGANLAGIALAPDGTLYACGTVAGAGGYSHWAVFASSGGAPMKLIDDFSPTAGHNAFSAALACDAAGDVYVVGYAGYSPRGAKGSASTYWFVREKAAGSSTFTTVDTYLHSKSTANQPNAIAVVSGGKGAGIYVGGENDTSGNWIVRKSANGGATWTTVDDWNYDAIHGSIDYAITADASGNLYAAGVGGAYVSSTSPAGVLHWIVRESGDGGASWSAVDDWRLSAAGSAVPAGIDVDAAGNVNVVGKAQDAAGVNHAILRSNAGGAWQTIDDYQSLLGQPSIYSAFVTDSVGISYAAGAQSAADGSIQWVVRDPSPVGSSLFSTTAIQGDEDLTLRTATRSGGLHAKSSNSIAAPAQHHHGSHVVIHAHPSQRRTRVKHILVSDAE